MSTHKIMSATNISEKNSMEKIPKAIFAAWFITVYDYQLVIKGGCGLAALSERQPSQWGKTLHFVLFRTKDDRRTV